MSALQSPAAEVQQLLDEAAIHRVLVRYCRGIDRMDLELIRSIYHPDAVDEHSRSFSGLGVDFPEAIARTHANRGGGQHHIGNTIFELDGDRARTETYFLSVTHLEAESGAEVAFVLGRYLDCFERREGEWRIAHRRVVHDLNSRVPHDMSLDPAHFLFHGARSGSDPSYHHFAAGPAQTSNDTQSAARPSIDG